MLVHLILVMKMEQTDMNLSVCSLNDHYSVLCMLLATDAIRE